MLEVKELTKSYRKAIALDHVSFQVESGTACGILGLNGAGKTTLLKLLSGLLVPDHGSLFFNGRCFGREPSVAALVEDPSFYGHMTGFDNLWLFYRLSGKKDKEKVLSSLEKVGLSSKKDILYRKYSLGMKKRLYLAFALMLESDLVLLDEPFNGLDPLAVESIKSIVRSMKKEGKTILISSHMVHDLQEIIDSAIILEKGKLVFSTVDVSSIDLRTTFLQSVQQSGEAE